MIPARPLHRALLALILLAGAAYRAAYLHALLAWPYHREALLVGDGRVYHEAALRIAQGAPWGVPVSWQDPLYPTFLALAMKLTGSDLAGPLAVQHLLGLASAALAWATARRMAGPPEVSRAVGARADFNAPSGTQRAVAGLTAAALVALSPVALYYEGLVEKSAPAIFLFALAAWALASGIARGSAARVGVAGAALALTGLLRANALLVLPAAALAIPLARPVRLRPAKGLIALVAGAAIVFAAVMARNQIIAGSPRVTSGQGGANFWIGNNPGNRTGTFIALPFLRDDPRYEEIDWTAEAERRAGRSLEGGEVSRFWLGEGLRFWIASPAAALVNTARKGALFVAAVELPDTQAFPFFRKRLAPLRLPLPGMGPILALALLGVAFSAPVWRSRAAELALLGAYAGSVVIFFVLGRYRIVALPLCAAFAGVAVAHLTQLARRRDFAPLAAAAAVLALALLLTARAQRPPDYAFAHFNLALSLVEQGRYEEARRPIAEGLALDPRNPLGRELEARVAVAKGDLRRADAALEEALRLAPGRRSARMSLARLRERQGRRAEAVAILEGLLREDPFDAETRNELGILRREETKRGR